MLLWAALVIGALAQGTTEPQTLTGTISLKGNVPFTYLCLTESNGQTWKLRVTTDFEWGDLQGQKVTIEVEEIPTRKAGLGPYPPEVDVTGIR
jgi:hypothetical protein